MAGLRELRRDISEAFVDRAQALHTATMVARAVFFAGAAAIAGVAQFFSWGPNESPTTAEIIGIAATIVVFVAAVVGIFGEKDASAHLGLAEKAIESAQQQEDELLAIRADFPDLDRHIALYQTVKILRDALEAACVGMAGDIDTLIVSMMSLIRRVILVATGFSNADQWTICVYRATARAKDCRFDLNLIAHNRAIECETHTARKWPEGRGVAGVAFSNSHEILVEDLAADGIRAVFQPHGLVRSYDDDRYRSMVAVPIIVDGMDRPWGVVTATSDRVAHFNHSQEPGLKPEEAIRSIADYVALAVAMIDARERAKVASPSVP